METIAFVMPNLWVPLSGQPVKIPRILAIEWVLVWIWAGFLSCTYARLSHAGDKWHWLRCRKYTETNKVYKFASFHHFTVIYPCNWHALFTMMWSVHNTNAQSKHWQPLIFSTPISSLHIWLSSRLTKVLVTVPLGFLKALIWRLINHWSHSQIIINDIILCRIVLNSSSIIPQKLWNWNINKSSSDYHHTEIGRASCRERV